MKNRQYRIALEVSTDTQNGITKDEFHTLLLRSLQTLGNIEADQVSIKINRVVPMAVDPGTAVILAALIELTGVTVAQIFSYLVKSTELKANNKELELKRAELEIKKEELDFKNKELKLKYEELNKSYRPQEADRPLEIIKEILVSTLRQQHHIMPENIRAFEENQDEM